MCIRFVLKDDIKADHKEVGYTIVNWLNVVHRTVTWQVLGNRPMYSRVPSNGGEIPDYLIYYCLVKADFSP
jgi:hypothetical protein